MFNIFVCNGFFMYVIFVIVFVFLSQTNKKKKKKKNTLSDVLKPKFSQKAF